MNENPFIGYCSKNCYAQGVRYERDFGPFILECNDASCGNYCYINKQCSEICSQRCYKANWKKMMERNEQRNRVKEV